MDASSEMVHMCWNENLAQWTDKIEAITLFFLPSKFIIHELGSGGADTEKHMC